jgi:RNA polymerase sigma-70 factor, ECF subfamily
MTSPDLTAPAPCYSRTDKDLVAAAKKGDDIAFETLIKRNESRIFAVALRYTRVHEDAEDIVQQTLQKVFVNLHKFQGKSSFSTWVTRIAMNESLMLLRKNRASREVSLEDAWRQAEASCSLEVRGSSPDPEMSYLNREAAQILFSAMAQLKPRLRVAMELKEIQELSGPDTSRHMGVSLSAVKARVFHGRKKLRQLLGHSTSDPRRSTPNIFSIADDSSACRKIA